VRRPRLLRRNTDEVANLIAGRVKDTDGRITTMRLLPAAREPGSEGSARSSRQAVAAKADWRRRSRSYRPWLPEPAQHLVIDWCCGETASSPPKAHRSYPTTDKLHSTGLGPRTHYRSPLWQQPQRWEAIHTGSRRMADSQHRQPK